MKGMDWCKIVFTFLCCCTRICAGSLEEAEQAYRKGERATTLPEREAYFNEALAEYGKVAAENPYSGRLQYNIGNSYYQLGEYAYAILHYKKALKQRPRDARIAMALQQAEDKLGLEGRSTQFSVPSSKERWNFFTISTLCALLSTSFWIATGRRFAYFLALFAGGFSALALLLTFYLHYFAPIEAVILRAASIHNDAGAHYSRLQEKPLPAGAVVEVLEPSEDGSWLRVHTGKGKVGYISTDRLAII